MVPRPYRHATLPRSFLEFDKPKVEKVVEVVLKRQGAFGWVGDSVRRTE